MTISTYLTRSVWESTRMEGVKIMSTLRLKSKVLLLFVLGLSLLGLDVGNKALGWGTPCGSCLTITDPQGHIVGYGCVRGGGGVCQAGPNYCSIQYTSCS
jgi:hypothetical protein